MQRVINVLVLILYFGQVASHAGWPPIFGWLPFNESVFTKTAGSSAQAYCPSYNGLVIGDQVILATIDDGKYAQRVNIYYSDECGVVVAWEGTDSSSLGSLLHDIEAVPVPANSIFGLPQGAVLYGGWQDQFLRNWQSVQSALQEVLRITKQNTVIVTGHSQGGALCQLAALAIYHAFGDIVDKVIAYASPRVGNQVYANYMSSVFSYRYVGVTNGQDWVYDVPSTAAGYVHPPGMIWIETPNSEDYKYFLDAESLKDAGYSPRYLTSNNKLYWGDHSGIYMHTKISGSNCPVVIGNY